MATHIYNMAVFEPLFRVEYNEINPPSPLAHLWAMAGLDPSSLILIGTFALLLLHAPD